MGLLREKRRHPQIGQNTTKTYNARYAFLYLGIKYNQSLSSPVSTGQNIGETVMWSETVNILPHLGNKYRFVYLLRSRVWRANKIRISWGVVEMKLLRFLEKWSTILNFEWSIVRQDRIQSLRRTVFSQSSASSLSSSPGDSAMFHLTCRPQQIIQLNKICVYKLVQSYIYIYSQKDTQYFIIIEIYSFHKLARYVSDFIGPSSGAFYKLYLQIWCVLYIQ